jgi:solute carrier family 35 (GDP-fucose transporter), member C1
VVLEVVMAPAVYSNSQIAGIVALYFVVSISLVFINKLLLSSGNAIPAPLFVTWSQCVVTVAICWLLGIIGDQS